MPARLKEQFFSAIRPEMKEELKLSNIMEAPFLEKVVINMGVGDAIGDPRNMDNAVNELTQITGQKPSIRSARKSISNFKLREGVKIGCMVTLRDQRMYEFVDRLFNIAMPRIRDFRGVSPKGFDRFGNFTLGIREQTIFPEVKIDDVNRVRGMNVTFVIRNAKTADEGRILLKKLGMPFTN